MNAVSRPDPLWSAEGARHNLRRSALGMRLHFKSNDEGLTELFDRSFGRFENAPEAAPLLTIDAVIRETASRGAEVRDSVLIHRERAGLFTASDGMSSIVADLPSGRAALFVEAASEPEIIQRELLESAVWRFATWQGMVAIHAATIAIHGRSLVLRGIGGAGKSTAAFVATRAGHSLVSEEVTWFDPGTPARALPMLRGSPWRIGLEQSATDLFPDLSSLFEQLADGTSSKMVIHHENSLGGWQALERAPIGPIVFLDVQEETKRTERSEWRTLSVLDAERKFAETSIVGEFAQLASAYRSAGSQLIARGAFCLRAGTPESSIRALEEIARVSTVPDPVVRESSALGAQTGQQTGNPAGRI